MAIKKGIFMNKNIPVAIVKYDSETYNLVSVSKILNKDYFPINVMNGDELKKEMLINWFRGRSIPADRQFLEDVLRKLKLSNKGILTDACFGLSLSDQYWINPVNILNKGMLNWEDINFFTNEFTDDIGKTFFNEEISTEISLKDPVNTSDGWLNKKWILVNNERYLVKSGSGKYKQEVFNELFATEIFKRINCVPFTEYELKYLKTQNGKVPVCACKCFCNENIESIPLTQVLTMNEYRALPHPVHVIPTLRDNLPEVGIPMEDFQKYIDVVLLIDFSNYESR